MAEAPQRLPGMEDPAVEALEEKALQYAQVRDERIGLSQKEGELKEVLLALMKAQERTHYHHGSITIDIVHEKENVKVKVKASEEELSTDPPKADLPAQGTRKKSGPKDLQQYHEQHPN